MFVLCYPLITGIAVPSNLKGEYNMLDELTNDSKFLLSSMYKEYLQIRKSGVDRNTSRKFGNEIDLHNNLMPEWLQADVHDSIAELIKLKYLGSITGDNKFTFIMLNPKAIAELETTFKDKIDTVLDYAAKIKDVIPFV